MVRRGSGIAQGDSDPQIVGGVFGLADLLPVRDSQPPFLGECDLCLVNARSGLALLIDQLSPSQVWMPSYLCEVMLKAAADRGPPQRFYEVDYDLTVSSQDWLEDVCKGDIVVLIDYFGFPADSICAAAAKQRGAWILEDACQALLSTGMDQLSDFVLFSPRKFLGVPDGGILSIRPRGLLGDVKLESSPADWWLKAFLTVVLRREFDIHGSNRLWFKLYQETETQSPIGAYAMSELSRLLLMHSIDYRETARKRIVNYQELARTLHAVSLFPNLPPGVVPLGFPIRVEKRDMIREMLFEHEIYPPVHWPIAELVPKSYQDSHRLAANIMTLPCDQRYGTQDMQRMADLVLSRLEQ